MIIVGIDFSPTAAVAVAEARVLAERLECALEVVHVREALRPVPWAPCGEELAWLDGADLDAVEVTVRRGTVWVELVRVAAERRADLIVIGTHGRTGFQPVALGTTAARLALLSPRPIVLVGSRELRPRESPGGDRRAGPHTRSGRPTAPEP